MPRQHRLWWVAPIGIFLALGIIVHWAAEQVGWIYTGAIFGFILVGILLWVGRTAIAQPLEKLFSLKVPQTALLFLWVTAILVLAVVTMGIVEDFVAGKLALNETGKIFFRILYPLAVAVVFFPYKQVTGVEPGLVLRGAGLLASIFLIAYLITQFSEARKTAALSLSSPVAQRVYTRGARFDLPELCPDSNLYRRLEQGEKVDWGLGNRPGCDVQTFNIQSGEAEVGLVYASGKIDQIVWRGTDPGFQFKERVVGVSMKANTPVVYRAY